MLGQEVLRRKVALTAEDRVALLEALVAYAGRIGPGYQRLDASWDHTRTVLRALERGGEVERSAAEPELLQRVRAALVETGTAEAKRAVPRVDALLGITADEGALFSNPDWCAQAMEDAIANCPSRWRRPPQPPCAWPRPRRRPSHHNASSTAPPSSVRRMVTTSSERSRRFFAPVRSRSRTSAVSSTR